MLAEYKERILAAIDAWRGEEPFTLKQLLGDQWPDNKGQAIVLGTEFRRAAEAEFPQLEPLGEDGRNHERYRKR